MTDERSTSQETEAFASAAEEHSTGFLREFWDFLLDNKKWWMLPIVISLLLVGGLVLLSTTAAAPFIYTLF